MTSPINAMIDRACGIAPAAPPKRTASEAENDIARSVASEVICHIDEMYPKMWEGVPKTARISVRNTIINRVTHLILELPKSEWSGSSAPLETNTVLCDTPKTKA